MGEQSPLDVFAKSETGQQTVRADHAMTRHDQTNRVGSVRAADGSRSGGTAYLSRDLCIRARLAKWDRLERGPHRLLEIRARRGERKIEFAPLAREILEHLLAGDPPRGSVTYYVTLSQTAAEDGGVAEGGREHGTVGIDGNREGAEGRGK